MNRFVAVSLALLLPTSALAWNHLEMLWFLEDMPIDYEISDYVEDSLAAGETVTIINEAYARWDAATCAQMDLNYTGTTNLNTTFTRSDGINRVSWDDPGDEQAVGVLASASPYSAGGSPTRPVLGIPYSRITDGDVVFNADIEWGTEDETDGTVFCPDGTYSVMAVAVHEFGHWWGLAHTCEEDDDCPDPIDLAATMYWSVTDCDNENAIPTDDDLEGVTAIYGPGARIGCSHELEPGADDTIAVGVLPLTVRCTVLDRGNETFTVDDASWYFGDGTDEEVGLEVAHTFTEPGNYSIRANITGTSDTCGEWDNTVTRSSYVRACGLPEPGLDIEHIDGRLFTLLNQTDLSVAGCIYDVQWDIFDEGGALVDNIETWEPEYEFPENGDYRIVLNVGGPAGTVAHELNVKIKSRRGEGYSTCDSIGAAGLLTPMLFLLPVAIRRRRE